MDYSISIPYPMGSAVRIRANERAGVVVGFHLQLYAHLQILVEYLDKDKDVRRTWLDPGEVTLINAPAPGKARVDWAWLAFGVGDLQKVK